MGFCLSPCALKQPPRGLRANALPFSPATGEGDGYLRMLSLVARQRAEHRKVQRLALDTSGHRQTHYQDLMRRERGEASMDTPEVRYA